MLKKEKKMLRRYSNSLHIILHIYTHIRSLTCKRDRVCVHTVRPRALWLEQALNDLLEPIEPREQPEVAV